MSPSIFSHRPWSDAEAREARDLAAARVAAVATRNARINHFVMGLAAFCAALAIFWHDHAASPWLAAATLLLVIVSISLAREGLDPGLQVRRWEFNAGYPPASSARLEALLNDPGLPPYIPDAIHRWQAMGYTVRRRDLDFVLRLAGRTDPQADDEDYFSYVLLRSEP
jgi:hypothetical protein